jgi:hypothetical protein
VAGQPVQPAAVAPLFHLDHGGSRLSSGSDRFVTASAGRSRSRRAV